MVGLAGKWRTVAADVTEVMMVGDVFGEITFTEGRR